MKNDIEKYKKNNLITFTIDIKQKQNKNGEYKKDIAYPKNWENTKLNNNFNDKHNGLALLTGKVNNIIVVDIDNLEHWEEFLEENDRDEPDTVKAISGSGGIHLYFKYSDELDDIKSSSKCFDPDYDIDIRSNGGNIIVPPTSYFNKNLDKQVEYKWEKSIFDNELKKFPTWMKKILLKKNVTKKKLKKVIKEEPEEKIVENVNLEIDEEDKILNFTISEIEGLLDILKLNRCNNYTDWINIGLCLHNINNKYLLLWIKWSQKSNKYQDGECDKHWSKFKKDKNGYNIGSMLYWAKNDNTAKYEEFMKNKKFGALVKQKYPNENFILGERKQVNDKMSYVEIHNDDCLIKGGKHANLNKSMYLDIVDKFMTVKCRHEECFGKTYPCEHAISLTKNEMIIANNQNVTIYMNQPEEELVEFQEIDIYENAKLNELVFNSLNGKSSQMAEIIYYYYENDFMYGEDNEWYIFENHKWKNVGVKNTKLRSSIQNKLKELYRQLYKYYKENDGDKKKLLSLKQIIDSFGETTMKNNIITELIDLYTEYKNPKRDFIKKLDSNNYLIGFNNGVYDLSTFEFRNGKNDDYITLSVGYDYNNKHTDKYDELLQFLEDIQPNKNERDYMLTYFSIGLVGNLLELFTILTGCGRNGKSKLVELLKTTFGDYFGSVQSQMFTRPRPDANAPDPDY
jgi:hypothetical protein